MSHIRLVRDRVSSLDYLSDRLIAAYFEAKEQESYYRSLRNAKTRRDFHEVITPVLIDFIGESFSRSNTQSLDAVIGAVASARRVIRPTQDMMSEARRLHPRGFALLQIDDELTLDRLKKFYRTAALRYHPDAGGSHDDMIIINEAYNLFHELLCQQPEQETANGENSLQISIFDVPIETTSDYRYLIGKLLLEIKLDEWSLDDAHYWATTLATDEWRASSYARHPRVRSDLLIPCSTLAVRLWTAGLKDQAQDVYKFAESTLRVPDQHGRYHEGGLFEADRYIKQGQKLRVVLNHHRQADNALRLGIIDGIRHRQTIERLAGKADLEDRQREMLGRYVVEFGFLCDLPTDRVAKGKVIRARLVPEPGYSDDRLDRLSDDQQAEYLRAFGGNPDIVLVRKYRDVRLGSLLRTMIVHEAQADFRAIEHECLNLASFQAHHAGGWACEQVAKVARHLGDLVIEERREKCEILRELNDAALKCLNIHNIQIVDSTFIIQITCKYMKLIFMPIDRLKLAKATGSTMTKEEEAEEREVWNRDINLIHSHYQREDFKAAWDALDRAKDDPERVLLLVIPYVETLLSHGVTVVHTEYLHVGFWIDTITIALTRLKRWEEAERWLRRFFALPERYRMGNSPSEQDSMRKRLERCRKMLGR